MASLVSDTLLQRSEEAVSQLESWLKQQEQLHQTTAEYKQLNSLCAKSKYISNLLKDDSSSIPHDLMEQKERSFIVESLIHEFNEISTKLNEIVTHTSPQSTIDSFEPKPLNLLRKNKILESPTRSSPVTRGRLERKISINLFPMHTTTKCNSVPTSPKCKSTSTLNQRTLRNIKSYHYGLNGDYINPFKENNRLSISFFNGDNTFNDNNSDSESDIDDDDTVLVTSPFLTNPKQKLKRSNSQDSVFWNENYLRKPSFQKQLNLFPSTLTKPTAELSSTQVFLKNTGRLGSSSKALLTSFVKDNLQQQQRTHNASSFNNIFNSVTSEIGKSKLDKSQIIHTERRVLSDNSIVISTLITSKKSRFNRFSSVDNISPTKKPIINNDVQYSDLNDALNTEFLY
ncbi:hypothetical protein KAFR_0D00120 [Kazachstania africana CBS 2517]|uniref:Uncharacterized protein n=1 Tax=Kazachstania africana (strain ATCC 22294 / BCRC 22015 / CBS 2517 / CECT 1963 / NBRC 1671 / NRRL Y-8276) TaxID=1071382 RepID=H2ATF8_KAZAF|nr:hypothetical protein KAFR_0D00120 [Kazachstania africana CBS 2517]CCF57658.1 hypothetical protein KAFR_0D00120 [Kazachstania africana CBS 2517]